MRAQLLAVCLLGLVCASNMAYNPSLLQFAFSDFKSSFGKKYTKSEELYRFAIFRDNLMAAEQLNSENPHAVFGVTEFSDLTDAEFVATHTGELETSEVSAESVEAPFLNNSPAEEIDHVELNHVSGVENQGNCGSCWAFGAVANIESLVAVTNGTDPVHYSKQQLVDCDRRSSGCRGGLSEWAYASIMQSGGVMSEEDYPYKARDMQCNFDKTKVVANIDDFVKVTDTKMIGRPGDEKKIKEYMFKAPVKLSLEANILKQYKNGIVTSGCTARLNHAVMGVGYGTEDGVEFWKVKNSWGTNFGEEGYFRIQRNTDTCGISRSAQQVIVPKNQNKALAE